MLEVKGLSHEMNLAFDDMYGLFWFVFLACNWSACKVWEISSGTGPLAGGLCKLYASAEGNHPMQRQLLLVQYKQQANQLLTFITIAPLLINRNEKNKQLKIIKPT